MYRVRVLLPLPGERGEPGIQIVKTGLRTCLTLHASAWMHDALPRGPYLIRVQVDYGTDKLSVGEVTLK